MSNKTSGTIEIINGYQFYWFRHGLGNPVFALIEGPSGETFPRLSGRFGTSDEIEASEIAEEWLISSGIVHLEDVSDEWIAEHPDVRGYGAR